MMAGERVGDAQMVKDLKRKKFKKHNGGGSSMFKSVKKVENVQQFLGYDSFKTPIVN
jgi:hypothetical protein